MSNKKFSGQFFTPDFIVDTILDLANYTDDIIKKHAIDNSCGDGAFLTQIVNRYIQKAISLNFGKDEIKSDLETFIHGIEIDDIAYKNCLDNLNTLVKKYELENINWDIINTDTLSISKYANKMDFVLGNPPYVRVHNLKENFENVKTFSFAKSGMTDLFIVFYEIGLKMLNKTGILGYITPSSLFNSLAANELRKEIVKNNLLSKVVDLKHFQAFNVTTYTAIVILDKNKKDNKVEFQNFDERNLKASFCEKLSYDDFYICDKFYFGKSEDSVLLKNIFENSYSSDIEVKNGYATLCDNVFIGDFDFSSKYIIKALKASTGKFKSMIYPYDENGKILDENLLKSDENVYKILLSNKDKLEKRARDKNSVWYSFGRCQGINDTYKEKIAINSLIKDKKDLKINVLQAGIGVYSGLYILPNKISVNDIKSALLSDEFFEFIKLLGKYKNGGYYTFSSKDIKAFLDFKFYYERDLFAC